MVETTVMRNSSVGDAWIQELASKNPIQWVSDENGNRTANVLSGPVRLNYPCVLNKRKEEAKQADGSMALVETRFDTQILFTPYADFSASSPIMELYNAQLAMDCQDFRDPTTGQYFGLHSPFRAQADKSVGKNSNGYTPGAQFITLSTHFKPLVVDTRMNPIVDESKVYAGVWAICSMNAYSYGIKTNQKTKGIGFGLITAMILADDDNLAGGPVAVDPKAQFGGVKVVPPTVNPAAGFNAPPAAPQNGQTNAGFVTPPVPQAAAPQVKTCWGCSNIIPGSATVCPFCNSAQG
jgi:hypothetical protein